MERKTDVRGKEREGDKWPTSSHQAAYTLGCAQLNPLGNLEPFYFLDMRTHLDITTGNILTVDLHHTVSP